MEKIYIIYNTGFGTQVTRHDSILEANIELDSKKYAKYDFMMAIKGYKLEATPMRLKDVECTER